MITAIALCAAQTALISALLVQRSRRRRAEQALRASDAALRSSYQGAQHLAGRLIAAQESERRRVARELHDNLSQQLALLCIDVEGLGRHASDSPVAAAESAARVLERVNDISSDVHCLSHNLHPSKLEILGLAPAIEGLSRDVSRQGGVRIEFRQEVVSRRVPADAALCLFRIAQQALQNVVKHSQATAAIVRLAETGPSIRLQIADNGKGFDRIARDGAGLGLLSMRERVLFAGGRIGIRSSAGRGTRIIVALPMSQDSSCRSEQNKAERTPLPLRGTLAVGAGTRFNTTIWGRRSGRSSAA
jgi:signal transduction histidine kinase